MSSGGTMENKGRNIDDAERDKGVTVYEVKYDVTFWERWSEPTLKGRDIIETYLSHGWKVTKERAAIDKEGFCFVITQFRRKKMNGIAA